jgi:hypothetical protein
MPTRREYLLVVMVLNGCSSMYSTTISVSMLLSFRKASSFAGVTSSAYTVTTRGAFFGALCFSSFSILFLIVIFHLVCNLAAQLWQSFDNAPSQFFHLLLRQTLE